MSVLVLAVEQQFWQDVLIEAARLGADIGHAAVHYTRASQPQEFFKTHPAKLIDGKMFYNLKDLAQLMEEHFPGGHIPLDKNVIEYFTPLERDFYILTDRFCFFSVSFNKRKKIFREAVKFWLSYFKNNDVTHLFTTCSPHSFADYTAYHVAKYLNIPVLQLAHTMMNDYVILRHDYREEDKVPANFLEGENLESVKKQITPQLFNSAFSESHVLNSVIRENDISQKIIAAEKQKHLAVLKKSARRMKGNFGKAKFKGGIAMNRLDNKWLRRIVRRYDLSWRRAQQKYYDEKITPVDFNAKYIYFAMHLQPERTSTPEAGIFEDHLLAIQLIAKSLPEGWKLYIKENPRQFDKINSLKGVHHRDKTDYDDILKLPNVFLLSQKTSSIELIKNAQIVSTLSGSVGWEALQSGKPVIIFGYSWYEACRACYKVSNIAECTAAINEAVWLSEAEIHLAILKYLVFMQGKLIIGNLGDEAYIKSMAVPYQTHVTSVAENMLREFQSIKTY